MDFFICHGSYIYYSLLQEGFEDNSLILVLMQTSTSETHVSDEHFLESVLQHSGSLVGVSQKLVDVGLLELLEVFSCLLDEHLSQ